jgi:hypothetical protein
MFSDVSAEHTKKFARALLATTYLLDVLVDHDNGGSTFMRNVSEFLLGYMVFYLRRRYASRFIQVDK